MSNKEKVIRSNNNVKIYNNIYNAVGFETVNGRRIELPRNGAWKQVKVEDLDYVLSIAPAMLKEGILYIKEKGVREYLDIEEYYENGNVIASDDIDELLKDDAKSIGKKLKKASNTTKSEVAKRAKKKSKELTGSQVDAIEKNTGISISDDT